MASSTSKCWGCLNKANSFCYVCGDFTTVAQHRTITSLHRTCSTLSRASVNDNVKLILGFTFKNSFLALSLSPSFHLSPSCNNTFVGRLTQKESSLPAVTVRILRSRDFARICIYANYFSLVQDLPLLNMLEAAISVSCFCSTSQKRPCALWMSRYVASITFTEPPTFTILTVKLVIRTSLGLHTSVVNCYNGLTAWFNGKKAAFNFAVPMVWRELQNHTDDCYFV